MGCRGAPSQQQESPSSALPTPIAALLRATRASLRSQLRDFAFLLFSWEAKLQLDPASAARAPRGVSASAVSGPPSVIPRARRSALSPRRHVIPVPDCQPVWLQGMHVAELFV